MCTCHNPPPIGMYTRRKKELLGSYFFTRSVNSKFHAPRLRKQPFVKWRQQDSSQTVSSWSATAIDGVPAGWIIRWCPTRRSSRRLLIRSGSSWRLVLETTIGQEERHTRRFRDTSGRRQTCKHLIGNTSPKIPHGPQGTIFQTSIRYPRSARRSPSLQTTRFTRVGDHKILHGVWCRHDRRCTTSDVTLQWKVYPGGTGRCLSSSTKKQLTHFCGVSM